ncbi:MULTISPECIES: hypothetical protein [Methylobacter]
MELDNEIKKLISVTNQQKGELLFLQALLVSIMRSTPPEFQSEVIGRFDKAAESTRSAHLYSEASDEVLEAFEHYVSSLKPQQS